MSFGFGVGDLLTISQFALQIYESCEKAPKQFAELRDQVKSLKDSLNTLQNYAAANDLTTIQKTDLLGVVTGFRPILTELATLLRKRQSLESKDLKLWQRLRWPGAQKLIELRSRFTSQLSLLSFQFDLVARSKQIQDHQALDAKLDKLSLQVDSIRLPQQLRWQMLPMDRLAGIIIPPIFLNTSVFRPNISTNRLLQIQQSLQSCKIRFSWDIIHLQTQLGKSLKSFDRDLDLGTFKALADFQHTFRDTKSFRYEMLHIVEFYLRAKHEPGSVIQQATKVLILSHLVSHVPNQIKFEIPGFDCSTHEMDVVIGLLKDQMSSMLRKLIFVALKRLLSVLEDLCRRGNPNDWPTVYLSLCTMLAAAESMAVDNYLWEPEEIAQRSVRDMEEAVMFLVLGNLGMSTHGLHPLDLDWSLSKNMTLIHNDARALYALRKLQRFREVNDKSLTKCSNIHRPAICHDLWEWKCHDDDWKAGIKDSSMKLSLWFTIVEYVCSIGAGPCLLRKRYSISELQTLFSS